MERIWSVATTEEAFVIGGVAVIVAWLIVEARRRPGGDHDPPARAPHRFVGRPRREAQQETAEPRHPSTEPTAQGLGKPTQLPYGGQEEAR